ncbi:unnamed protein product [Rangifer tarandus platyrhynchus]|uniref:Transmembrane protein 79 n=1 Tax=Rangifer tarandus platyrhynchus TaxID=3082113 RepID=A0ABN8Y5I6_RANTA|nr:unnamed protein product [Rangifer tarandus platyrhynchus]
MTEPETLALLEVKWPEALEKSPPQALVPNGQKLEGEDGVESLGVESSRVGSSAESPTAREGTEDGLDSTATHPEPPECKWAEAVVKPPGHSCGGCGGCGGREVLRAVASVGATLILFPCLLYGTYAFLPFDAPRLPTMSSRLLYTLRCGVFATFPIVLGILVYGLSLLCFSALRPFGEPRREVEIHRRYVAHSVQLFILYFFNLAVLSTYLPQDTLKLLPLLTGLFAISRLIYWLTFAVGRSFRGFGYGLTFLPLLSMLMWNFYYMFVVEPERMLTASESRLDCPDHARSASDYRPRSRG